MQTIVERYDYGLDGKALKLRLSEKRTVANLQVQVGDSFIPDGIWASWGAFCGSSIVCLELAPEGYRFRRVSLVKEEVFFLTPQALADSHWVPLPSIPLVILPMRIEKTVHED